MNWKDYLGYAFNDLQHYVLRDVVVNWVAASRLTLRPLRYILYRLAGIQTATMNIRPGCRIKFRHLVIGKDTFINDACAFENWALVTIGERCAIGPEVMFCSTSHELGGELRRGGPLKGMPILIGDGCWIGARAVILPGSSIESGCVIAAGAVVSGVCEANGLYGGVPARRIKELPKS